jgi:hypothetical protein
MSSKHELGDAPVEPEQFERMNALAQGAEGASGRLTQQSDK